jgi:DNA-binding PadR family transcriptional regulator
VPKNALDNPLILPILGLLAERPRHPYAVFAELRRRYAYLPVRNATVYTLLDTLKAVGLVELIPDGDHGDHGQLRINDDGAAALAERVEREIRGGDLTGGPAFMTALAYLSIMPPARAAEALEARAAALAAEARRLQETLNATDALEVHMIEAHYLQDRLQHDTQWLTATVRRIQSADLAWPTPRPPAAARDAADR